MELEGWDVCAGGLGGQQEHMHRQGWSIRGIAKELDVGLNIVRRYLREETPSAYRPRPKRPSILDPYKDYLRARLEDKPEICAKVLPSEPPARGYPGAGYAHQGFHPAASCRAEATCGADGNILRPHQASSSRSTGVRLVDCPAAASSTGCPMCSAGRRPSSSTSPHARSARISFSTTRTR